MATCSSQGLRGELVGCAQEVLSVGRDPMHFLDCCLQGLSFEDQELEPEQSGNVPSSLGVERGLRTARNLTVFSSTSSLLRSVCRCSLQKKSALEQDRVANGNFKVMCAVFVLIW